MGKILIYGGSGGIGLATAKLLKTAGHLLHLAGRNAEALNAAASALDCQFTVADVTDAACFSKVTAEAGDALDGLVYAAGTINLKPLARLTAADFTHDFQVNAMGAALAVQAALPALKAGENNPAIVLFSTIAVRQGFAAHASIGMAKGAVEGLTLSLAAELSPRIRVNAIAPSLTRTAMASGLTSNAQMATAIAAMHPLGRLGEAEDIAGVTAFLLSPQASWMTGQVIGVDGGRSTLRPKG